MNVTSKKSTIFLFASMVIFSLQSAEVFSFSWSVIDYVKLDISVEANVAPNLLLNLVQKIQTSAPSNEPMVTLKKLLPVFFFHGALSENSSDCLAYISKVLSYWSTVLCSSANLITSSRIFCVMDG